MIHEHPVPPAAQVEGNGRPAGHGGEFYRSRVVIAEFAGAAAAFGPVHTAGGLANLVGLLQSRGWCVTGHIKLTGLVQLAEHNSDWPSAPAASVGAAAPNWQSRGHLINLTGGREL
jgi:hypothetical protein